MAFDAQKALIAYAGVTTAALTWFLATAAMPAPTSAKFGDIDVQRINVREPDGTLRMTISSAAHSPGIIVRGREYRHPDRQAAGMIFFNDEGTENGGLIFGGREVAGKQSSYGSLTFDRYEQDQTVQMIGDQDGEDRHSGLAVFDRPEKPFDYPAIERAGNLPAGQRAAAFAVANVGGQPRAFVGRDTDKSSQVALRDGQGHKRLVMRVAEDGGAEIDFLAPDGSVVRRVTPTG
jgi:hypothetical protein